MTNNFVEYLNTLHNYKAQNPNAYGEKNVQNPFYKEVIVRVGMVDYICEKIRSEDPQTIILTGHAGDGKTSILYQVLEELNKDYYAANKSNLTSQKSYSYNVNTNNTECYCIKDFSEFSDEEKISELEKSLKAPKNNKFSFIVANTGPLINTFGKLFDPADAENYKMKLIDAMDNNTGEIIDIAQYKICVINIATIDNTYFVSEYIKNIISEKLWEPCKNCSKCEYCHIYMNRNLIYNNIERVSDFITKHYIWLTEHGKRLTIRSMAEQLSYMLTGGKGCADINKTSKFLYLFSNLFFGYKGVKVDTDALKILSVKEANDCAYYSKRLRADEKLFIEKNYKIFSEEVRNIIEEAERSFSLNKNLFGEWIDFLRRTYLLLNIETDEEIINQNWEDAFSKWFKRFCELRNGATISGSDSNLIRDALSMIYVGNISDQNTLFLTLSQKSEIAQNIQLITGSENIKYIKLVSANSKDNLFNKNIKKSQLLISVNGKNIECEISLPLFNYFEELKNGVISTNVDPQLSHGLESIKAQLSSICGNYENFGMIIDGKENVELTIENGRIIEE